MGIPSFANRQSARRKDESLRRALINNARGTTQIAAQAAPHRTPASPARSRGGHGKVLRPTAFFLPARGIQMLPGSASAARTCRRLSETGDPFAFPFIAFIKDCTYLISFLRICQSNSPVFHKFSVLSYYYSLLRWILPLTVLGSSSLNSTIRGYLYGAVWLLT